MDMLGDSLRGVVETSFRRLRSELLYIRIGSTEPRLEERHLQSSRPSSRLCWLAQCSLAAVFSYHSKAILFVISAVLFYRFRYAALAFTHGTFLRTMLRSDCSPPAASSMLRLGTARDSSGEATEQITADEERHVGTRSSER